MNSIQRQRRPNVRRTAAVVRFTMLVVLAALALVPERLLPGGRGIELQGAFAGRPLEIRWTAERSAPYRVVVVMETGICDFVLSDAAGTIVLQWSTQNATDRGRVEHNGTIQLLPRPGAAGRYHLRVGLLATVGWVLTAARVLLLGGCALAAAALVFGWRLYPRRWERRRLLTGAAAAFFSGIVLYSIVHEAGHLLFGWLFGGTLDMDQVRWTIFSGEEPHAAFRSLPPEAVPWMAAGGVLLPSFVGSVLALACFWRVGRMTWWPQLILTVAGAMLLVGNLGLFVDTGHTLPLAIHFGLGGILAQAAAATPAVLTLTVLACIAQRTGRLMAAPARVADPA